MSHGFRKNSGRALCLAAAFGLLAVATPGCDDAAPKKEEGASPIPKSVQESNKNMEDFMKAQNAQKK
jgi:hypothetical protein